jgi:hypothetical protein
MGKRTIDIVSRRSFLGYSAGSFVLLQLGCSSDESKSGLSPEAESIKVFGEALSAHSRAASKAHQGAIDTIEVASQGFTLNLTVSDPPGEVSEPHAEELSATAQAHVGWTSAADALLQAGAASAQWSLGTTAMRFVTPGLQTRGEPIGTVQSPLLFTTAILLGGLALTAYGAYKGTKSAVDTRAEPVKNKIGEATPQELTVINQTLGLPADTPKDETASHFNNLGMGNKLIKAKAVEQGLRNAETNNEPGVSGVEATAINKSVAASSVKLGETAVKTTVSAVTTATGGQGYSQAMEAVGVGAKTAAAIDLGISAVSTATDVPLQPLDILADNLTVVVIDKDREPLVIPKPTTGMTPEQARQTVNDPNASGPDVDEAMSVIAMTTVGANADGHQMTDNGDGTVTVMAPARVHIGTLDKPTNHITMKVPDMGPADILIMADGKVPKVVENVDTSTSPIIGYEDIDLEDYDGEAAGDYSLLVVTTPADPGPGESVLVTAQINPAESGVAITMSVTGTDGYSDSLETTTDGSGQATLSIPGGEEGVTDTVTVALPEHGVSQTMSYAF